MAAPAKSVDTGKIVDQLTASGVPVDQAKAHATVLADALQMHTTQPQERFVTKEELREELRPIRAAIAELQAAVAELQTTVAELQTTVAALDAKLDTKVLELNAKIDMVKMELYAMIEASAEKLRQNLRRDLPRYFALFVLPLAFLQAATLAGLMLGVFN